MSDSPTWPWPEYDPDIAALVAQLLTRGVSIKLTKDGPEVRVFPGAGAELTPAEAASLRAHKWQLWRYLPWPTACLECAADLPPWVKTWYCRACCEEASTVVGQGTQAA